MRTAVLILVILIGTASAAAYLASVRLSIETGDLPAAIAGLRELEAADTTEFEKANLDYLLARSLADSGQTAEAMQRFSQVARGARRKLRPYALWHLATLARASGNFFLERIYLIELAAFADNVLLAQAARVRLGNSYLESRDFAAAIRILGDDRGHSSSSASARSAPQSADRERRRIALLAQALALAGRAGEAREHFEMLLRTTAVTTEPDDHALAAASGLDAIDGSANISEAEHLRRAFVYQFNRDFWKAREHYKAVVAQYPGSASVPRAVVEIGRTYVQEREFAEALKWFERDQEHSSDPQAAKEALLQAASAYSRIGKYREAAARYQKYIGFYPTDERVDRAYLNMIDTLRDAGEDTEALVWAAKTAETFRGKLPEALAAFAEARIHISRENWTAALPVLERLGSYPDLGGSRVPGGTDRDEITFLRAYVLERLGRYGEAVDAYLSVPDGRGNYYGEMANRRLAVLANMPESPQAMITRRATAVDALQTRANADDLKAALHTLLRLSSIDADRSAVIEDLRSVYSRISAYRRFMAPNESASAKPGVPAAGVARELWELGLYDEAAGEFEASISSSQKTDAAVRRKLANAYRLGDRADRADLFFHNAAEPPPDFRLELLDDAAARSLYPTPFKNILRRVGSDRGLDPRFMLAIIRQESGFRRVVKSNAAARGLMQFISSTARQTSRELGRENFRDEDLYDPATAILFGAAYVEKLFRLYDGMPDAVAASYNGGEDNVKRWLSRARSRDAERYVPELAYSQSKEYVYRVMSAYRAYEIIYDRELNTRSAK